MATKTTSIGSASGTNLNITGVSGSDPWTITIDASSVPVVGDTMFDETATPLAYLITTVTSTTVIVVVGLLGNTGTPSFAGGGQASVIRTYSTMTLWEADLDDTDLYDAADDAVGECYDDSAFDETLAFDGGGTISLTSATLTVAAGERHDGTAGTGARMVQTTLDDSILCTSNIALNVDWLEVDGADGSTGAMVRTVNSQTGTIFLRRMIIHDVTRSGTCIILRITPGSPSDVYVLNCMVYGAAGTGTTTATVGLRTTSSSSRKLHLINSTIHDILSNSDSGDAIGLDFGDVNNNDIINVMITTVAGSSSGTKVCYSDDAYTSTNAVSLLASDATASGTDPLDSKAATDQFVSIVAGSEDLHLKSGADAIDAGADQTTTPTGVEIDIDGRDRDAEGDTWDIGAHEFVAVAGGPKGPFGLPFEGSFGGPFA